MLVGKYSYIKKTSNIGDKQITITYNQDSSGNLNGEYKAEFYQECCSDLGNIEDIIKYENGVMIYRLCREKTNGTVYYKFENGVYSKTVDNYSSKDVFSSTWDAHIGANIWIGGDCQYCGTGYNPLFAFTDGINIDNFILLRDRMNLE
jgi:hypothetical protein